MKSTAIAVLAISILGLSPQAYSGNEKNPISYKGSVSNLVKGPPSAIQMPSVKEPKRFKDEAQLPLFR